MNKILVVEDDLELNEMVVRMLNKSGFQAYSAINGQDAINKMNTELFALIISDIMMPLMDGYEFANKVREKYPHLPILFISAKNQFEDKRKAFEVGIDDYMVKPIDLNELILRVNALLRRAKISSDRKIEIGSTCLNYDTFIIQTAGKEIILPQKEFLLLFKLLSYPNKIFTRAKLMDEIWGLDSESTDRTVDVHITKLREKFADNPDFEIVTIRGLGYKAIKKV